MADVLVNGSVDNIMYSRATSRMGPYWRSTAIGHLIIMDNSYDVKFQKTINSGTDWTAEATIAAATILMTDTFADLQVSGDAGTLIHIVYLDLAASVIRYVNLDMSDDSVNGDILIEACQGTGTFLSGLFSRTFLTVTKARGGNLAIATNYLDDASTRFENFRTSIDNGANWVVKTSPWEADGDYMLLFPANLADNQDLWGLYYDSSAQAFSLKTFDDDGNSWSEVVFGSGLLATSLLAMDGQVRKIDGKLFAIWWTLYDNANASLECWEITNAGTIVQRANVVTTTAESVQCSIFIDQVTGHLYVFYFTGTEWFSEVACWYRKSTDSGATWGAPVQYQANAEADFRWLTAGAMGPSGRAEPVIFEDDGNDLFVSVDNSIEIAEGGAEVVEGSAAGSGIGSATSQAILEVLAASAGSGIGLGTTQALIHVLAAAAASGEGLGEAEALLEVIAEAAGEGLGSGESQSLVIVIGTGSGSGVGEGLTEALLTILAQAEASGIGSGLVTLPIEIIDGTGAGSGIGTASAEALLIVLAEAAGSGVGEGSAPRIIRLVLNIKRRPEVHNLGKVKSTPHDLGESLNKYTLGGRIK